jgi:hypothetical protein
MTTFRQAASTTRTGSSSGSEPGLTSTIRRLPLPPSGIVSPGLQFGTAVARVGGSAGEPSSCSSVKVNGLPEDALSQSLPDNATQRQRLPQSPAIKPLNPRSESD